MPENLLAIDNGTQSVRTLVLDPRGNLVASQRVPIEPYYSTAPSSRDLPTPCVRVAERTVKRSGVPITELRVAGGGSQSDAALQLTADVFGLPSSRPHVYEASCLGAAVDAAVGAGLYPDFATAIREMTRVRDTFEPDAHNLSLIRVMSVTGLLSDWRKTI